MRRSPACRRDGNHDEIMRAFGEVPGCVVEDCHKVGSLCVPGFPDLIIAWRGRLIPVEVKWESPKLTAGEEQLHARWKGCGVTVEIVRTRADVYRVLGLVGWREDGVRGTEF